MIKNIVITHGYSDSNKGDLAITQGTINYLKFKYPKSNLILLSTFRENDPDFWFHNRMIKKNEIEIIEGLFPTPYIGNKSSFYLNILASLRLLNDIFQNYLNKYFPNAPFHLSKKQKIAYEMIKKAELVVIKGGQFIYNDRENLRGNLFMWRTLQPIKVAKSLNKKIFIFGQSFGGFYSKKSEKKAINYLKKCDTIFPREKKSFNFLKKYNLGDKAKIIPDLAFYLKKNIKISNKIDLSSKKVFGITVVNWNYPEIKNIKKAKQNYFDSIVMTCKKLKEKYNYTPIFIPQVIVRHHGSSDVDLIKKIRVKLNDIGINSKFYNFDFNLNEVIALYQSCEFLIGTRLHSCILASCVSTPIIPIRYQGFKTQGIAEELNQSNLLLDIHKINTNSLFKNCENVITNKKKIKRVLDQKTNGFVKSIDNIDFFD